MSKQPTFPFKISPIFTLSEDGIISNIIQINSLNLLFDCGWNESFSQSIKDKYVSCLSSIKIDAIFLTNNYLNYIGGLPLIKSFELNANTDIYATTPIAKLGVYIMADAFISAMEANIKPLVNLVDSKNNFSQNFFKIKDVKYHQSIKINASNNEDDVVVITPIPSGKSLGGCAWKISYKLQTWIYAPEFSIEPRFITDAFNYENLKNKIDFVITDTLMTSTLSVVKIAIESEFKKKISELFSLKKTIFIPTDSVNTTLELIIRLEKIIDEFSNSYPKSDPSKSEPKPDYHVLVCGYCSTEITEGVKRLTEFMGTNISQQYYTYSDNPFNFKYISCAKDINDFNSIINQKKEQLFPSRYVILSSFASLNFGLSHNVLPTILENKEAALVTLTLRGYANTIADAFQYGKKTVEYEKWNVKSRIIPKDEEKEKAEINKEIMKKAELQSKEEENKREKTLAEFIRRKLFAKSQYKMFSYVNKRKFTDYGITLSDKEVKLMKNMNMIKSDNYQSAFQGFLNKEGANINDGKDFGFKLSKYAFPSEIEIEKTKIDIKCDILNFPLENEIDIISKKIILEEISPREGVLFLGGKNFFEKKLDTFFSKINFKVISNEENFEKNYVNNIIKFKYDSSLLPKGKHFSIHNYKEDVFEFLHVCLKVKRKRDKIIEISACDLDFNDNIPKKEIKIAQNEKNKTSPEHQSDECFYSKDDLKLLQIKRELEKVANTSLYIIDHCIINEDKSVKIKLNKNELILEGDFSQEYITLRNYINEFFMNSKQ